MGQEKTEKSSIDLESWNERSVPSWLMYLLVGVSLFCLWILFAEGCEKPENQDRDNEETTFKATDFPASFEDLG